MQDLAPCCSRFPDSQMHCRSSSTFAIPCVKRGRRIARERSTPWFPRQAARLLRQLDADLTAAAPYRLADPSLSFWTGSPPLAAPAFGATSPTDLASTLPSRRDFIETLAGDYAAPLVNYLRDPGDSARPSVSGLVARWQAILNTLDRYHRSDPSNSLTRLEQFILVDMDKIDLSNCRQMTTDGAFASDYFAQQLQIIRRTIASRCRSTVHAGTTSRYTSLAADFNAQLAGRFPFAPVPASLRRLAPPTRTKSASFSTEYGPDLPALEAQFASGAPFGQARQRRRDIFDPTRRGSERIRPNARRPEPATRRSPTRSMSSSSPIPRRRRPRTKSSTPSSSPAISAPVRCLARPGSCGPTGNRCGSNCAGRRTHRWCPTPPLGQSSPRINGLSAIFDFSGNWALLRLIRAQTPDIADLNSLQDRRPEVVMFEVPLRRNPDAAVAGDGEVNTAKVYLRLALTGLAQAPGQPAKTVPIRPPGISDGGPAAGPNRFPTGPATSAAPTALVPSATWSASP